MNYITTKQAARNWNISDRMVLYHCNSGRISGAVKVGNTWLIPKNSMKPEDKRYRREKYEK